MNKFGKPYCAAHSNHATTTAPRAPRTLLIWLMLVLPLGAFAQRPPMGAGIPIPTISIGTDGIKLNLPRFPGGPGRGPGGPGMGPGDPGVFGPMAGGPPPAQASGEAELEAFRLALAAQATPAQVSAYSSLVNSTRAVVSNFEDLRALLSKSVGPELTVKKHAFDDSLSKARTSTKTFLESFSEPQRDALKQIASKLLSADARLAERSKILETRIGDTTMSSGDLVGSSNRVEEAIANFREHERLLGKVMYALADPEEEQPIFTLPASTITGTIGNQTVAVRTSGTIFRAPAERLSNGVHVQIVANLGDLQQSMTQVLQSLLTHPDPCGNRVTVQQSMVSMTSPTAEIWVQLHLERRTCLGEPGSKASLAVMEGNGAITVNITPVIKKDGVLTILTQTEKVEANGMLAEMLRSGAVGDEVREKIKLSILRALQNGLDLQTTLLPVQPDSGVIETAKFIRDSQSGTLDIALDGHLRLSDQQIAMLAGQKSGSATTHGSSQP